MRILVTGATGLIGGAIIRESVRRGLDVRGTTRRGSGESHLVQADLLDPRQTAETLRGVDVVIHAAASAANDWADTVRMTENVLAAAPKRVVLISSMSVIDYSQLKPHDVVDENSPTERDAVHRDGYARAKLRQENLCRERVGEPWSLTILRPGAVVAAGRVWTSRLGMQFGKRWVQVGRDAQVPLIHVDSCARFAVACAMVENPPALLHLLDDDPPTQDVYVAALVAKGWLTPPIAAVAYRPTRLVTGALWPPLRLLKALKVRVPHALVPASLDARFGAFRFSNARANTFAPELARGSTLQQLA